MAPWISLALEFTVKQPTITVTTMVSSGPWGTALVASTGTHSLVHPCHSCPRHLTVSYTSYICLLYVTIPLQERKSRKKSDIVCFIHSVPQAEKQSRP